MRGYKAFIYSAIICGALLAFKGDRSFAFFADDAGVVTNHPGAKPVYKVINKGITKADSAEIFAVLDTFMVNFRKPLSKHLKGHLKAYLFPHVRIASAKVKIVNGPEEFTAEGIEAGLPKDWEYSEWVSRDIVQASPSKVHFVTVFRRFRKDGSVIADESSLYILEKVNGRWGIRGRSSYAK